MRGGLLRVHTHTHTSHTRSEEGTCEAGFCVCNPGFLGEDCELQARAAPSESIRVTHNRCPRLNPTQQQSLRVTPSHAESLRVTPSRPEDQTRAIHSRSESSEIRVSPSHSESACPSFKLPTGSRFPRPGLGWK